MKEFNLKKELTNLKSVKADLDWKANNRDILNCQIHNSLEDKKSIGISEIISKPQRIFQFVSQPAFAVFSIALILIGGGSASLYAANNTKPGDPLYIAKLLSEKAQLVITFDEVNKNKLGLKFANNRALDIAKILAETNFEDEGEKEKATKLTEDFKKEITIVKSKINNINHDNQGDQGNNENQTDESSNNDSFQVFSADFAKDGKGIQVFDPTESTQVDSVKPEKNEESDASQETDVTEVTDVSTSTEVVVENTESSSDASDMINKAEQLFNEQDYNGAHDQLQKVDELLDSDNSEGEVKGVSESASSTVE